MARITKVQKENILKIYKFLNKKPEKDIHKLSSKEAVKLYRKLLKEFMKKN